MPESAILANLRIRESNGLVYPNTVSDNVSLPDGSKLTEHVNEVKAFEEAQSAKNKEIESWESETDDWKGSHTHSMSQITDLDLSDATVGVAKKVSNALKITINGGTTENDTQFTFDGSRAVTMDLTPDKIGAAAWDHTHPATDITGIEDMVESKIQTVTPSSHTHNISDITGLNDRLNAILDEDYYRSDIPSTTAVGGIPKGWLPPSGQIKVTELLNSMLHPYVSPSVSASILPTNGGTVKYSESIEVTQVRVNATKGSNTLTKIEVYSGSTLVGSLESSIGTSNVVPVTMDPITVNSQNKNLSVRLYDDSGKYVSANTGSFSFVYPYYYGISTDIPTVDTMGSLTELVKAKGNQKLTFTMNQQRAVFACYKGYGAIKTILDPNGFDSTNTFTRIEVTYNDLPYYLYYNSPSTNTNFAFTFNY